MGHPRARLAVPMAGVAAETRTIWDSTLTLVPAPRPRPAPCSPGGAPNRRRAAARESALRARARGARGRHREPHPSTQLGSGRRAAAPPARPFLTRCYRSLEGAVERQPSTGGWRDGEISPRCAGRNPKPKPCSDPSTLAARAPRRRGCSPGWSAARAHSPTVSCLFRRSTRRPQVVPAWSCAFIRHPHVSSSRVV